MKKGSYHFIGIGGVGMSALAHILLQKGHKVSGSDISETAVLKNLREAGASIRVVQERANIVGKPIIVYSTIITESNPEFIEGKLRGCRFLHRSDLLEELLREKKAIIIAGSHGKTTVTTLFSHTLECSGLYPSYVIGGFSDSIKYNGSTGSGEYFLAEGDESDGSFLKTSPYGAILTNVDFDHIEYYWKTKEALIEAFKTFISLVQNKESFFYWGDDPFLSKWRPQGISYGLSPHVQLRGSNVRLFENGCKFDIEYKEKRYTNITLSMPGVHNVLNAMGVFGLAIHLGAKEEDIRGSFASFSGVKRRFQFKGEAKGVKVYDDYAHHPNEISRVFDTLDVIAKDKRVIVVFQPHRYSRLFELMDDFADVLGRATDLVITDVYAAGENMIEGITSEILLERIGQSKNIRHVKRESLTKFLLEYARPNDLIITLGAGDVTQVGSEILQQLM
jgi:UDP-N-acetylmuramate--alanine ligase